MLHLMESAALPSPRRRGWMVVSTLAHATLVAVAMLAGTRQVVARPADPPPERLIYTAAARAPEHRPAGVPAPVGAPGPGPRIVIPTVPVPVTNIVIPTPTSFVEGSRAPSGNHDHPGLDPSLAPGGGPGIVFDRRTVDRAVAPLRNSAPDYPATLRAAGVSGDVLVRFIVDTSGRVEPASIEILLASHDLFAVAVRRWLQRTRYIPAQASGVEVRQLVEQRVEFDLRP